LPAETLKYRFSTAGLMLDAYDADEPGPFDGGSSVSKHQFIRWQRMYIEERNGMNAFKMRKFEDGCLESRQKVGYLTSSFSQLCIPKRVGFGPLKQNSDTLVMDL